ncbi:MAG TPA: hypothetical protein VK210_16455 [Terriglobia bacterium]|nr:hypothetical protein [Terriglobia bacterium]
MNRRNRSWEFSAFVYVPNAMWRSVAGVWICLSLLSSPLMANSDLPVPDVGDVNSPIPDTGIAWTGSSSSPSDYRQYLHPSTSDTRAYGVFATPDFRQISSLPDARTSSTKLVRLYVPPAPAGMPAARQQVGGISPPSSKTTPGVQKKKSKLPWILAIAAGGAGGVALAMKKSGASSSSSSSQNPTPTPATVITVGAPIVGAP